MSHFECMTPKYITHNIYLLIKVPHFTLTDTFLDTTTQDGDLNALFNCLYQSNLLNIVRD